VKRLKKTVDQDRRSGKERRENQIPFFKLILFKGKRRSLRRADDRKRITVLDQYHPSLFIFILVVLALSLVDAILTLTLMEKGAIELNPVMRYYITLGPMAFVVAKYGLTVLPLVFMLFLNGIISERSRIGLLIFPFWGLAFGSVVIWELYLLSNTS
jgi:hypothetical protein